MMESAIDYKRQKVGSSSTKGNKNSSSLLWSLPPSLFASAILDNCLNRHEKENLIKNMVELREYVGDLFCEKHFTLLTAAAKPAAKPTPARASTAKGNTKKYGDMPCCLDCQMMETTAAIPPADAKPAAAGASTATGNTNKVGDMPCCLDCQMMESKSETRCEVCREFRPTRTVRICLKCKTYTCRSCESPLLAPHRDQLQQDPDGEPNLCQNCDVCAVCPIPDQTKAGAKCGGSAREKAVILCPGPFCQQVYCRSHSPTKMVPSCDMQMLCRPRVTCEVCADEFEKQDAESDLGSSKCRSCPNRVCYSCTFGDKKDRQTNKGGTECSECQMGDFVFNLYRQGFPGFGGSGRFQNF